MSSSAACQFVCFWPQNSGLPNSSKLSFAQSHVFCMHITSIVYRICFRCPPLTHLSIFSFISLIWAYLGVVEHDLFDSPSAFCLHPGIAFHGRYFSGF